MLCRSLQFSRCLPTAHLPLRPYCRTLGPPYPRYATSVAQSSPTSNRSVPLERAAAAQPPENAHTNHVVRESHATEDEGKTRIESSKPTSSRNAQALPSYIHNRRARVLRHGKASPVRLRFVQKKSRIFRSPRYKVHYVVSYTRSKANVEIGIPNRRLRIKSSSSYLSSPHRMVSLGQWANASKAPSSGTEHHGIEQTVDELVTSWSSRIMCLEEGRTLRFFRTIRIELFVRKYASIRVSRKLLHQLWLHLPVRNRLDRWQDTILWCMQNSPKRALVVLLATFKGRVWRPPRYMVQDCLQCLSRHFLFDVSEAEPFAINAIWRLTLRFVEGASSEELRSYSISQDAVHLLLKHCGDTQAFALYERLDSNRANLHPNTLLHFLERFVNMGKLDLSMKLLEKIGDSSPQAFLSSDQIQMACVKLLRTRWGMAAPYRIQSIILSRMLEMGIRPNTQMYNVILLTMIEGYDFQTAWQMFDIAKQSDHFHTDSTTYSILAKGAKLSGNSSILDKVLCDTKDDPDLQSDYLTSEILGAISEFSPGHEFSAMLEFYQQHHDIRPLQDLGVCGLDLDPTQSSTVDQKWPTKYVLGQLILAYNKLNGSTNGLIQRYNLYHDFVQEEHPLIAPLARDDYVANSFIMAFGQKVETLPYCTMVIKHMLSPPPSPDSAPYATPTVITWSILLSAYMRHGQKSAAEKVLTMMRDRGQRPDRITWNSLISGYSAMQNMDGALGAMRRMEAAGFESNSRTLKALGRLWDRGKLLDMLKVSMEDNPDLKEPVDMVEGEEAPEAQEKHNFEEERARDIRRYLEKYPQTHM